MEEKNNKREGEEQEQTVLLWPGGGIKPKRRLFLDSSVERRPPEEKFTRRDKEVFCPGREGQEEGGYSINLGGAPSVEQTQIPEFPKIEKVEYKGEGKLVQRSSP